MGRVVLQGSDESDQRICTDLSSRCTLVYLFKLLLNSSCSCRPDTVLIVSCLHNVFLVNVSLKVRSKFLSKKIKSLLNSSKTTFRIINLM